MKKSALALALSLLVAAVMATVLTLPAAAQLTKVIVRLPDGTTREFVVDAAPGASLQDVRSLVPGEPVQVVPIAEQPPAPQPPAPAPAPEPAPAPAQAPAPQPQAQDEAPEPADEKRDEQERSKAKRQVSEMKRKSPKRPTARRKPKPKSQPKHETHDDHRRPTPRPRLRRPDGSPTRQNPGLVDALPGPAAATGVPNFVIRKFRVPVFLLPIYQAAGIQYGVRWEVLAAINEIETDYGRNLNVSSAGALGWMQFMPATWKMYGTDGNKDGRKDPYNPVDAIFAAARYLKAAGYEQDVRKAIFAYNHADWYVDSVILRSKLIAGVPADLVGSLTGLTEGRFPVYARARYADDLDERDRLKKAKSGQNAANVVESNEEREATQIFARRGSPVVATNDGVVKQMGVSKRLGRYVVLQDVYGNRFMYAHLGSVARYYPVPKEDAERPGRPATVLRANGDDARPSRPASAGRQPAKRDAKRARGHAGHRHAATPEAPVKERLFANPNHKLARDAGGLEQLLDMEARLGKFETFSNPFSRPYGLDAENVRIRRLREGSRVIGGTILGRLGQTVEGKAPHLHFEIRPAGKGAPRIDPKPILDGWKLLEATAIYGPAGRNVLHGDDGASVGQIMMMSKPMLAKRVLADERIEIYDCGRADIRSGHTDRRVLATLAYLAETGFRPTVTSLKCGHGFLTASGNVSHHSSGNALDIAKVNGIPIMGHQERGGITEQTVRQLMRLQGTMRPDQIISLLDLGANSIPMADHADHIHVGFRPRFGANEKLGKQAFAVLKPGQWTDLLSRLRQIENPVVPTRPSRFSIPARKGAAGASSVPRNPRALRPLRGFRVRARGALRPIDKLR